ncbi:uncharacterized protein [Rutidosis leptorrhynchoides]|uniref:uncharacterized protein n=1 Tax=Rutidosis leptorrhynchoides TaxID=125765 RepID=UPI003A994443
MGNSRVTIAMREFRECVDAIHVMDINQSGLRYMWNQSPLLSRGMLKKIDRVMVNEHFINMFTNAYAIFQPYRISDHSPAVLKIPIMEVAAPKPFRFSNYLVHRDNFQSCVIEGWKLKVTGHKMYGVVKRLKALRKPICNLMWEKGNIHERVKQLRIQLDEYQVALDLNLSSTQARDNASRILKEFNVASLEEEQFLKQKAKVEWL